MVSERYAKAIPIKTVKFYEYYLPKNVKLLKIQDEGTDLRQKILKKFT